MTFKILPAMLWMISLAALLVSAVTDLKERIIPNEMVLVTALSGILLGLTMRPGQIGLSLAAATLILLALGVLCRYRVIAGGDAKLIAAVTLLVSPGGIVELLTGIALAGGFLSCLYLGASCMIRNAPSLCCDAVSDGAMHSLAAWARVESARIALRKHVPLRRRNFRRRDLVCR